MLNHEFKQYLVDNNIKPVTIEVQSRSTQQWIPLIYFKHDIGGDSYARLSSVSRNLFTTCALTGDTILVMPKELLGSHINLMDAIDSATLHLEGRSNRRVRETEGMDLSKMAPTPVVEKTKPVVKKPAASKKGPAASAEKKTPARKKAPSKKKVAAKKPSKK